MTAEQSETMRQRMATLKIILDELESLRKDQDDESVEWVIEQLTEAE